MTIDPKATSAELLLDHARALASALERFDAPRAAANGGRIWSSKEEMAAHEGARLYDEVEFVTRVGFLTKDEALETVRQGLGDTISAFPKALGWATDHFQKNMSAVMANSFGQNPRHPFNQRILRHDDPGDRVRSWCESLGSTFLTAYGSYDQLKERMPEHHPGTKEERLERLIASARRQIEFAVELRLVSVDAALDHIDQGMTEALESLSGRLPSVTNESVARIRHMVEAGIRQGA